jgi:hypothetical protein
MARMVPSALSADVVGSESRCFAALRDRLDGAYTVLYDVGWVGRGQYEGQQGQCDFLVLHPDLGALVIEVKGGTLRRDADGAWTSTGRDGDHQIDDPFAQANRSKFALREYLRCSARLSASEACWGHAVWFSDSRAPSDCGPGAHSAITLDYASSNDLDARIRRAFAYWSRGSDRHIGADGVGQIVSTLGRPLTLRAPLAAVIADEAIEERRLTEEQYRYLTFVDRQVRVVISGPAGSGKTMLGLEQCRRFAEAGMRTLYVCFNRRLADWMRRQTAAFEGVTANTFHGLIDDLAAEAGIPLPPRGDRDAEYFENRSPNLLFEIASESGPRFDALIVDEAQDFHDWWLTALEPLLVSGHREMILLDSNQQIFGREARRPLLDEALRLTVNCRTTRAIHRALAPYVTGDVTECTGPEGRAPERVLVTSDRNEARQVQRALYHLTHDEEIALNRIVVLTPRHETSHWKEGDKLGNFTLTWKDQRDERTQVLCASIHAFKGMESDVVLLTEMAKIHDQRQTEIWYTALSRARHHVVIFEMAPETAK